MNIELTIQWFTKSNYSKSHIPYFHEHSHWQKYSFLSLFQTTRTYNSERPSYNLMEAPIQNWNSALWTFCVRLDQLSTFSNFQNAYVPLDEVLQLFTNKHIGGPTPGHFWTFSKFSQYGLTSITMECLRFGTIFGP